MASAFIQSHGYWVLHVPKFKFDWIKSLRPILKFPFICKAWGYWMLMDRSLLMWTTRQLWNLITFSWEKSLFLHDSCHFSTSERRGSGWWRAHMLGKRFFTFFNPCYIDFPLWFMEIALFLNHTLQLRRILISSLPFVSHYKSHWDRCLLPSIFWAFKPLKSTLSVALLQAQTHSKYFWGKTKEN